MQVRTLLVNVAELKAQLAEAHEQRGAMVANLQRAEAEAQQQAATAAAMREAAEMYEDAQARVQELEDFGEYTEKVSRRWCLQTTDHIVFINLVTVTIMAFSCDLLISLHIIEVIPNCTVLQLLSKKELM